MNTNEKATTYENGTLPEIKSVPELVKLLSPYVGSPGHLSYLIKNKDRWYKDFHIPKKGGGTRLVSEPAFPLNMIQRRLLHRVFNKFPVTDNAHGFVRGRDIISNVSPHVGKHIIIKMDLEKFFDNIGAGLIYRLLERYGYRASVTSRIVDLVTKDRKLPQGAPTSPALSNATAQNLDHALTHFVKTNFNADYTRYADDLTFSGDKEFERKLPWFFAEVRTIIAKRGFIINEKKLRIIRISRKQKVTGIVANEKLSIDRKERDKLRALLHNAYKCRSLESQNREGRKDFEAHIRGKIQHIKHVSPPQGGKLEMMFNRVLAL